MNTISANPSLPARRPATSLARRRRFHHHSTAPLRVPVRRSGLSVVAAIITIGAVALGILVATALIATGLAVVVASGWQDQTAALMPLALSALIFTGLGSLVRRWIRHDAH